MEGVRRIAPLDFQYARRVKHTIRRVCGGRKTPDGLILFVRPALIPSSTILASVQGPYNAVWVKGVFGEDTFYYGWGAGHPTGVAGGGGFVVGGRGSRGGAPGRAWASPPPRPGAEKHPSVGRSRH